MGKLCENQQEIYAAYRVANLLGVYEDCSPNGFYQRWKQKNAFMKVQAEEFGIGSTDHFIDAVERTGISGGKEVYLLCGGIRNLQSHTEAVRREYHKL